MPCYQTQLYTVQLEAADRGLLTAAVRSLFPTATEVGTLLHLEMPAGRVTLDRATGTLSSRTVAPAEIDALRTRLIGAYATAAVKQTATRFGLTTTTQPNGQLKLSRRF